MSFTRISRDVSVHQSMPDYPSGEGYTATQLKQAFDAPAEGIKTDVNGLMGELEDTTAASNIGAAALDESDTSDANLQAKVEKIHAEIQGVALGDIPDGTITQAKLNATYEGTIAKKDSTLQEGLNSEKINSKTEAQLKASFLATPNPTTLSYEAASTSSTSYETATESKTVSTNGGRYYLLISSYLSCQLLLFDAQTEKFVFGINTNNPAADSAVHSYNVAQVNLKKGYSGNLGEATISGTYNEGTLTFSVTKKYKKDNSVSAGTVTVFELGGIVS